MPALPDLSKFMKLSRRKAREDALQILFQQDLNNDLTLDEGVVRFQAYFAALGQGGSLDEFTIRLVKGVMLRLREIDSKLRNVSEHWRLERMAAVDRNVLRLGVFELCFCDDIPSTVTINEMVEIAKTFGAEDSSSFVNGVLDKVRLSSPCPNKVP